VTRLHPDRIPSHPTRHQTNVFEDLSRVIDRHRAEENDGY